MKEQSVIYFHDASPLIPPLKKAVAEKKRKPGTRSVSAGFGRPAPDFFAKAFTLAVSAGLVFGTFSFFQTEYPARLSRAIVSAYASAVSPATLTAVLSRAALALPNYASVGARSATHSAEVLYTDAAGAILALSETSRDLVSVVTADSLGFFQTAASGASQVLVPSFTH